MEISSPVFFVKTYCVYFLVSFYQFLRECDGSAGGIIFAKANSPLRAVEEYIWNAYAVSYLKSGLATWQLEF